MDTFQIRGLFRSTRRLNQATGRVKMEIRIRTGGHVAMYLFASRQMQGRLKLEGVENA